MVHLTDPRKARPPPVSRLASWPLWTFEDAHLNGHCSIAFSGGSLVHQIPVSRCNGGTVSVGSPNAADLDREGCIRADLAGKKTYGPAITFESAAGRERWNTAVLAAGISPAEEATP